MKRQFRILPYKMGSKGAGSLSEGLRERLVRGFKIYPDRAYTPRRHHTIINWGCSNPPNWMRPDNGAFNTTWLNKTPAVANASNKLTAFQLMKDAGISIPEFTDDWEVSRHWEGKVVARYKLSGHSGDGIVIIDTDNDTVLSHGRAPLYVKYIKKQDEYRVHVFRGEVLDVQQKKKRQNMEAEDVDFKVRNHKNGWVYCREGVTAPASVTDNAIRALEAVGLDFGAVDVIWNNHYQKAYVLEVNTAPGLEGTTLEKYVNKLVEVI